MALLDGLFRGRSIATEANERTRGRISAVLVVTAIVVAGIAGAVPLVQNSGATATGYDLRDLERTRDDWQARVHSLEADVAALGSLDRIEREATERIGMVVPDRTIFIETDVSGPAEVRAPSHLVPRSSRVGEEHDGSSWWERLLDALVP